MAYVIKVYRKRSILDKLTMAPREFVGFIKSATWMYRDVSSLHCHLITTNTMREAQASALEKVAKQLIDDIEWYFADELEFVIEKDSYP